MGGSGIYGIINCYRCECRPESGGAVIRSVITDMNKTYPQGLEQMLKERFGDDTCVRISMEDVDGRIMYCSDEAFTEIQDRLSKISEPYKGVHFIDTGNFHYMSRVFTSFIDSPYDLLLLDHHTDMQEASFGGILSCGSWAGEALEKDENLRSLTVIGPGAFEEGGEELSVSLSGREASGRIYKGKCTADGEVPLYISVDKDVMNTDVSITNWDQGDYGLDEIRELIGKLAFGRVVAGADICGGISESDPGFSDHARDINTSSDIKLYEILREFVSTDK